MISHPMTSLMRLLLALMVVLSGCQLESLSQRQSRQRQQFLGAGAHTNQPLQWIGHLSPDADAAISSLMAAHLYGGQASVAGPLNPETRHILERCNQASPSLPANFKGHAVGLVDFNQRTQLASGIESNQVVAIVDHHAIGDNAVNLQKARRIDLRPWGATASILEHHAQKLGVTFPRPLACAALGAILSDTLGLTSPLTTSHDRQSAQRLARRTGVHDLAGLSKSQQEAKSDLSHLSAEEIILLDYKQYLYGDKLVGIGVAETLKPNQLLSRQTELQAALAKIKAEQKLDHLIFSITDINQQRATLIGTDPSDEAMLQQAFGGMVADGVVSRKRQIAPAIQGVLERN